MFGCFKNESRRFNSCSHVPHVCCEIGNTKVLQHIVRECEGMRHKTKIQYQQTLKFYCIALKKLRGTSEDSTAKR